MSLLQYTSDEMFSSTELVRKNKRIFDKLNKKEIEKAIILRDGKPAIMLLDFFEYEKIMNDYLNLKRNFNKSLEKSNKKKESIDDDYEAALKEIDNLDIDLNKENNKEESLKEFWD